MLHLLTRQRGIRLTLMFLFALVVGVLPGRAAVDEAKDLYFVGAQTNWQVNENYKFTAQTADTYVLSLRNGILGEWLITDGNGTGGGWQLGMDANNPTMSVNSNYTFASYGSSLNFNQQTVGATEISVTLYSGGAENGPSNVYVSGCHAPANVYMVGGAAGWDTPDENYKFTPDYENATENSRKYTLELSSMTANWKIWDGTWSWNFGVGGNSQPDVNVESSLGFDGGNITSVTQGAAKLTFTYIKDSNSKSAPEGVVSKILIEGDAIAYPDKLHIIGNVKGDGWTGWGAAQGIEAVGNHGIYYFPAVEFTDDLSYFRLTPELGTDNNDWDTCNSNNYGASEENKRADSSYTYEVWGSCGNNWTVSKGKYNITVDLSNRRLVLVAIDDAGLPQELYMVGNLNNAEWDAANGFPMTKIADGKYKINDVTINNNGHDLGEFCITTVRDENWDLVNLSPRYGPVDTSADRIRVDSNTQLQIFKGASAGQSGNYMMAPGRYDITADMSDPNNMLIYADQLEAFELDLVKPRNMYMVGNVNGTGWSTNNGVTADVQDGVYTFDRVTINDSGDGMGYFNLTTTLGANWDEVNQSDRFGAIKSNELVTDGGVYTVYRNTGDQIASTNSWKLAPGVYTIKVNLKDAPYIMSVAKTDLSHDTFAYTEEWFSKEPYNWKDKNGIWHVSYLNEPATDTEQMKYFVSAVYSNKKIPGNKYVKYYDFDDANERIKIYPETMETYPGSGKQMYTHVRYNGIEGLENYGLPMYDDDNNLVDYTPNEHGVTAILVELNIPDEVKYLGEGVSNTYSKVQDWIEAEFAEWKNNTRADGQTFSEQDCTWLLDNLSSQYIKSMQVLTERSYFNNDINPGYLFNVNKPLKHFFIVLKGHPRKLADKDGGNKTGNMTQDMDMKYDIFNRFEQISPTTSNRDGKGQQPFSAIDQLKDGKKFQVIHDCSTVLYQDHYFCMDRQTDGDYEVHANLYIYIPDARMTDWQWNDQYVIDAKIDPDVTIDENAFGRDWWFIGSDKTVTHKSQATPIGAFTNYNPKFAPYIFAYNLKLSLNGFRPKVTVNDVEEIDTDHYQIDLSWESNLASITGANDEEVQEEFLIYPLVDGQVGAPLKASDLYSYSVPEEDRAYTTITVAGAGDNVGALIVRTILPMVRVNLVYNYGIDEEMKTVDYVITGCLADKSFDPVQSNQVNHTMDGSKMILWAAINEAESRASYNPETNENTYTNVVELYHDPISEEFLKSKHMKNGTKVYLMRKDVTDLNSNPVPLAYFDFTTPQSFGEESTPRFGNSWVYYWAWNKMPGYNDSELRVERAAYSSTSVTHTYQGVPANAWDAHHRTNCYLMSKRVLDDSTPGGEDLEATVYPQDYRKPDATHDDYYNDFGNHMVYWRVYDTFSESIEGNNHADHYVYYYVFDSDGNMFDVTNGTANKTVTKDKKTNEVSFFIPKSEVGIDLMLYNLSEVQKDAQLRHLPFNSSAVSYNVTNHSNIQGYSVYRKNNNGAKSNTHEEVARTERNRSGIFEAHHVSEGNATSMGIVSEFDQNNVATMQCPIAVPDGSHGSEHDYFGVITMRNGRQYGVAPSKGVDVPALYIKNAKIYSVTGEENLTPEHLFCSKELIPLLNVEGYDMEFAHYNVWRVVHSKNYPNAGNEELVRDHNSLLRTPDVPIGAKHDDFNSFEQFFDMSDGFNSMHFQQDCFLLDKFEADDEISVDYIVRVYAKATKEGSEPEAAPGKHQAPAQPMYVIAEYRTPATYVGSIMTGVDDVVAGSLLNVRSLGGLAVAIDCNSPVAIYNTTGMQIASLPAGNNQHVDLPTAGIYIVSSQSKSVKIAVK